MFNMCARMEWNHLPVAGGIYDQDPELIRRWEIIFAKLEEKRRKEEAQRERERKRKSPSPSRGRY